MNRNNLVSILITLTHFIISINCYNKTNANNTTSTMNATQDHPTSPPKPSYSLYQRYKKYPNYCSTPTEMTQRSIPPLQTTNNTKLIQVISIIRHGARTPYSDGMHCWANYKDIKADTAKWDCNLDTIYAPPSSPSITPSYKMILEKKYDALKAPLGNELNGTCQLGQLLFQGYIQEVTNGQILKKAYLDTKYDHMHLFHNTSVLNNETHLHTYYRADDMQRTLMSGQVLLTSLFNSNIGMKTQTITIPIHTTDKLVDILEPNTFTCPKLNVIKNEAYASKEFTIRNTSQEAFDVRNMLYNVLHTTSPVSNDVNEGLDVMIDCLMTTICTDRTLPDYIDYDDDNTSNFMRILNLSTWKWLYVYQYKEAAYSKLAMAPLWADIYERMVIATSNKPTSTSKERLVLYSGHDVTIMTLLASLHVDVVNMPMAPYASLLNIEIHAIFPDEEDDDDDTNNGTTTVDKELIQHGFRLVYNGQVITSLLPNCPNQELCPISTLFQHISSFATRDRMQECTVNTPKSISTLTKESAEATFGQNPIISIVLAVVSCFVGGYATFYFLVRGGKRQVVATSEDLVLQESDYGTARGAQVFDVESELI